MIDFPNDIEDLEEDARAQFRARTEFVEGLGLSYRPWESGEVMFNRLNSVGYFDDKFSDSDPFATPEERREFIIAAYDRSMNDEDLFGGLFSIKEREEGYIEEWKRNKELKNFNRNKENRSNRAASVLNAKRRRTDAQKELSEDSSLVSSRRTGASSN